MIKTPIYVEMTLARGWDPLSMTHPSLVEEEKALIAAREAATVIPTPLLDDVIEHGVGPWDDKRRKALGSATVNLVRKSPMPPRPRKPRATRGKR